MPPPKSSFLDKVLGRIGRLDAHGLQTVVQRLARERSFLETLFNTIEDGVVVVDENGRILYLNQAASRLLGLQSGTDEGQHISRSLPDLDWEQLSAVDSKGGQKVVRHEFEIDYPRPRFVRLYAAPLDGETSGSSGMALILHDATEARQKTAEAIETERIQALTLLAASVAHEVGNPLYSLQLHFQLIEREFKKLKQARGEPNRRTHPNRAEPLARPDLDEIIRKLEHFLTVAKDEVRRLDYIVKDFLQAVRPTPPQFRRASLNDVVLETLELLRPEFDNRGQKIEEKLARSLPESPMDPGQIKQALVNLAKNAMQAMGKGGVLAVQTGAGVDDVWVSISDTGRGIRQEESSRIYEPFYTTKKKGSGLGLMIVHRIVQAHGGRIELESQVGKGTTFRVRLPLRERPTKLLEAQHG